MCWRRIDQSGPGHLEPEPAFPTASQSEWLRVCRIPERASRRVPVSLPPRGNTSFESSHFTECHDFARNRPLCPVPSAHPGFSTHTTERRTRPNHPQERETLRLTSRVFTRSHKGSAQQLRYLSFRPIPSAIIGITLSTRFSFVASRFASAM